MTTYAFSIAANLAGGDLETKEGKLSLGLPALGRPIDVYLRDRKEQTGTRSLTLWCGGFNSEEEARAAGGPVKTALLLAGVQLGIGIDVGRDEVVSPAARRTDGQPDEHLQPDVHGLQVVPELKVYRFGFLHIGRPERRTTSAGDFQERVASGYWPGKLLTDKQTLAALLYAQSHFLESAAARFVMLISAVEALAESSCSSAAACALVDEFRRVTKKAVDLDASERQVLLDGLGRLKRESISSACRALVREHCGERVVKDFTRLYGIRSDLLHRGESPSGPKLEKELYELERIVRSLVVAHITASWST